jgi:Flp pilus assembly protein TadG
VKGRGCARLAQRGQALVFVTIVMLVVLLALVTMYSMGQLTTEKMRLQNTADAAAYSSALAQARDYNFSAYTNRAMVANQVVVAQLVGLTSWARNYNDTFATLTPQVEWMAQGIVARLMWSLPIRGLRPAARTFSRAMDSGGPIVVKLLYGIIDGLGYMQMIYHYGPALTVAQMLGAESKVVSFLGSIVGAESSAADAGNAISSVLSLGNNYNVIKLNDPDAALSDIGL